MHNERTQHIVAIYGFHSLAKSSEYIVEERQKLEKAEKYRAHERDNRKDFFTDWGENRKRTAWNEPGVRGKTLIIAPHFGFSNKHVFFSFLLVLRREDGLG